MQLFPSTIRTVSARMDFAVVGPIPKMYWSENSILFWLGISTPATRAACILSGALCRATCYATCKVAIGTATFRCMSREVITPGISGTPLSVIEHIKACKAFDNGGTVEEVPAIRQDFLSGRKDKGYALLHRWTRIWGVNGAGKEG